VETKHSRRVYIYWGIALVLLLALGTFCWAVVVPLWQTRTVISDLKRELAVAVPKPGPNLSEAAVQRLGGRQRTAQRLLFHLRHYGWLGEGKKEWEVAVKLLVCCEVPDGEPPFRDREISTFCTTLAKQAEDARAVVLKTCEVITQQIETLRKKDPNDPRIKPCLKLFDEFKGKIGELDEGAFRCRRWALWLSPDGM